LSKFKLTFEIKSSNSSTENETSLVSFFEYASQFLDTYDFLAISMFQSTITSFEILTTTLSQEYF
jgi:hypothetical protein